MKSASAVGVVVLLCMLLAGLLLPRWGLLGLAVVAVIAWAKATQS